MNDTEFRDRLQDLADDAPKDLRPSASLLRRARRRVLLVAASCVVLVAALVLGSIAGLRGFDDAAPRPARPPEDVGGPISGGIAYRSGPDILAVDPESGDTTSLVSVDELDPLMWSQDGTRLLLRHHGPRREPAPLYVMDRGDSEPVRISDGSGVAASFSPNGERVVQDANGDLYVTSAGENALRELRSGRGRIVQAEPGTRLLYPAWSPDGSQIAFVTWERSADRHTISVVNATEGRSRTILRLRDNPKLPPFTGEQRSDAISELVWSPDGSQLAFVREVWENALGVFGQIFVVRADGSNLRQLTNGGHNISPVFSPDGSQIAFVKHVVMRAQLSAATPTVGMVEVDGGEYQDFESIEPAPGSSIAWNQAG